MQFLALRAAKHAFFKSILYNIEDDFFIFLKKKSEKMKDKKTRIFSIILGIFRFTLYDEILDRSKKIE